MKFVGRVDDEYANTLWRLKNTIQKDGFVPGSVYLIYDQKGYGLDLVCISEDETSSLYVRALESELLPNFECLEPSSVLAMLEAWISRRKETIKTVSAIDPDELLNILNDKSREDRYNKVLTEITNFQVQLHEWEDHIKYMDEFPGLRIDRDRPVRRTLSASRNRSGQKVGKVLAVAENDDGYIVLVCWDDGSEEDIAAKDIENVPE